MKFKIPIMFLIVTAFLTACGGGSDESPQIESTADLKEVVNDYSTGEISEGANHQASITAQQLIISEDDDQVVYDLPEDEFFVSIAPFINETHP